MTHQDGTRRTTAHTRSTANDHRSFGLDLFDTALQFVEGDIDGMTEMPARIFTGCAHINDHCAISDQRGIIGRRAYT